MPTYSYTLYSNSKSESFTYSGGITGTLNISLTVKSTDAVVREGTQLQIVFNASESESGGSIGADIDFDVFGTEIISQRVFNSSVSKTVNTTYSLSNLGRPSSATQGAYDHLINGVISVAGSGTGMIACDYTPNISPTVNISCPAQIYAGQTIQVRTSVSDFESDKLWSGYSAGSAYNSSVKAVYKLKNGTTRTVTITEALSLGTTDWSVQVPSGDDYVGATVYFVAVARDSSTSATTAQTPTITISQNYPPTATILVSNLYPGGTADISWGFTDPDAGQTVITKSLVRYYQAKNSTAWNTQAVSVSANSKSAQDSIPVSYNGGTIYYKLTFTDQIGSDQTAESARYTLKSIVAPPAPSQITYSSSFNAGQSATVTWTASPASANDEYIVSGYEVERSYDGGSTWAQIYHAAQPNTLSISTTISTSGVTSVIFRVRAFDDESGLKSNYTTGETATVINNAAPSMPPSITVPANISTGQSIVIKWEASTDPDGDTITYVLERKVNSGSFTVVAQRTTLNYTDTVGSSWTTVQYRVKAVDSHGASSRYKTSAQRTVNQNRVPTITCQYADGTDLGVKSEIFSFTFSVNDQDQSDTLTVKEYIDDVQFYSFTATRNTTYTFDFLSGARWDTLVNGSHKITITVSDTKATKSLSLYFVKSETGCSITLTEPLVSVDNMYYVVFSMSYTLPYDNLWTDENTFNMALFNEKFANIDVLCVGASDEPDVNDWETCKIDTTSTVTKKGTIWQQGNNLVIPIKEGNIIIIHKFTSAGKKFNYRIIADTSDVDDLGHICSVQGAFGFASITFPSWS